MDVTFSPALRVYAEMWEIAGRRRAADATGMLYLGHRYYYGQDVACDQAAGIRWYHRAAEAGSDAAMSQLAGIYEADKHYKEAARWYRRYAAERIRWRNQRMNW